MIKNLMNLINTEKCILNRISEDSMNLKDREKDEC